MVNQKPCAAVLTRRKIARWSINNRCRSSVNGVLITDQLPTLRLSDATTFVWPGNSACRRVPILWVITLNTIRGFVGLSKEMRYGFWAFRL